MVKLVREHWGAAALAVLVGVLMIAPPFYFRYFDGGYQGLDFLGSDHEDFYVAQIQEIYDGHWSFGNSYLTEGKESPYVFPPLSPIIMALLGKFLGLSALDVNLITKFLFPAFLTAIIYFLFLNFVERKGVAILMAAFIMLTQATWIFLNPGSWLPFLSQGEFLGTDKNFLSYARTINPQISSIFFFGYLLCFWKFLFDPSEGKSKKWLGVASAVLLGLSFYVYFYAYSFLVIFTGLMAFWFLVSRDWRSFQKVLLIFFGALVVSLPYWLNFWEASHSPLYAELSARLGMVESRRFVFSRVWWGTAIIFLLAYRKFDKFKVFILTFLAAAFIAANQQLLTGRTAPMLDHYHWYYTAPVSGAILIYLLFLYLDKIAPRWFYRAALILSLALFIYAGVLYQKVSYAASREWVLGLQRYAPLISWLDKNIQAESAILADNNLSKLIPAYTRHNVYGGGESQGFLVPESRLRHNLYINTFLNGVEKGEAKDYFYENRDLIIGLIFGIYYREKTGCFICAPDVVLDELVFEYQDFLDRDFIGELKKYRIDYLVWDKKSAPEWRLDRFFNERVYEDEEFLVYKVI